MKQTTICEECEYLIDVCKTKEGNIVIACEKGYTEFKDNCPAFKDDGIELTLEEDNV